SKRRFPFVEQEPRPRRPRGVEAVSAGIETAHAVVERAACEAEQCGADLRFVVRIALPQHGHAARTELEAPRLAEARAAHVAHEHVAGDDVAQTRTLGPLAEVVLL